MANFSTGALKAITAALFLGSLTAMAGTTPADLGERVTTDYLQPATQRFNDASRALNDSVQSYCANPDAAARDQVEARLTDTVTAWAGIDFLRFGPLVENNRLERVFFYPDNRGVTLRQTQALLASQDPQATTPTELQKRSVAVQGLPALEFLLFGTDAQSSISSQTDAGRYRCALAASAAGSVYLQAQDIAKAWAPGSLMATEFTKPAETNSLYRNTSEVATEVVKALSTGLQLNRDIKLLPALGQSHSTARGQLAPLWRSQLTQTYLKAGTESLLKFYEATGFSEKLSESEQWIHDSIVNESQLAATDFADVKMAFIDAVQDEENHQVLMHAALVLNNIKAVVDEYLAGAFAINIGFNSLDGD